MIKLILIFIAGAVLGFVIASGSVMSTLRGKGYGRLNDIPAKARETGANQVLANELTTFFDHSVALREKHGLFVEKMTMSAEFSDGTNQTFDVFKLAADCVKNETLKNSSLVHAVYGEMIRLKTSREDA